MCFLKSAKKLANYNTDTKDNQRSKFFILKKKGRDRKKMQNQSNEVNASSCIIYSSDFTPLYRIKIWFLCSRTVLIRLPSLSLLSKVSNQLISASVLHCEGSCISGPCLRAYKPSRNEQRLAGDYQEKYL